MLQVVGGKDKIVVCIKNVSMQFSTITTIICLLHMKMPIIIIVSYAC